ncbi:MAG: histidine phosphatase family protein [Bradymonadaceae bacterium]|nr:histidine phosphatase family protein [Lujinxingiaceae bacterium]
MKIRMVFLLFALIGASFAIGCRTPASEGEEISALVPVIYVRVFVVRHAQAWKNVDHPESMTEQELDSLTPQGLADAKALGELLRAHEIVAVISSPAGRARQTAEALSESLGLEVAPLIDPQLAYLVDGTTEGGEPMTWKIRLEQLARGEDVRPVGGESLADGRGRALGLVGGLLSDYRSRNVIVVTHGDIAATLVGEAAGTPLVERPTSHDLPMAIAVPIYVTSERWLLLEAIQP